MPGERYYHMASQILKMYEDFEMEISDINNLKTGRIHLGTTNHLGTLVLPRILPRFLDLCPYGPAVHRRGDDPGAGAEAFIRPAGLRHHACAQGEHPASGTVRHPDPGIPLSSLLPPAHPLLLKAKEKPEYHYPVLDVRLLKHERFLMLHTGQRIRQVSDAVLTKAGSTRPDILINPEKLRDGPDACRTGAWRYPDPPAVHLYRRLLVPAGLLFHR